MFLSAVSLQEKKVLTNAVTTKYARVWEDDLGIIHIVLLDRKNFSISDAREYLRDSVKLAKGIPKPIIFDMRNLKDIKPSAASQFLSEEAIKITKACAVIINSVSSVSQIAINFYMKLSNSPFPVKFFRREEEAIEWLKEFI